MPPWIAISYANTLQGGQGNYLLSQWWKQHANSSYFMENENTMLVCKGEDFRAPLIYLCRCTGLDLGLGWERFNFLHSSSYVLKHTSVSAVAEQPGQYQGFLCFPWECTRSQERAQLGPVPPIYINIFSIWLLWQPVYSGFLTDFVSKFVYVM